MLKHIIRSTSAFISAFVLASGPSGGANARPPFFAIGEIYSNADGSVQFVKMNNVDSTLLAGQTLTATDGMTTHSYVFPGDLPAGAINHTFLVASQGFADLNFVKPDYVVPNGFLFYPSGIVRVGDSDFPYTGLPTDGVHAFWGDPDLDRIDFGGAIAVNFAGERFSFPATPQPNFDFGGLWWNSPSGSESGWGIAVEHQGNSIFAAWATYDSDGSPTWFVILRAVPRPNLGLDYFGPNTHEGTMYRMSGPAFASEPFDSSKVTATPVAIGGFHFDNAGDSMFFYGTNPDNGHDTRYKSITHEVFADPVPVCTEGSLPGLTPNFQGMWWNPAESGWGLYIAHQGDILFAIWFTYDASGKATWLTFPASKAAINTYSGPIYRTTGPAYDAARYDPLTVKGTQVGTATLMFSDRDNGTFSTILPSSGVDGVAKTESITRLVFASPRTVCN